jgi:hypothetical protein
MSVNNVLRHCLGGHSLIILFDFVFKGNGTTIVTIFSSLI